MLGRRVSQRGYDVTTATFPFSANGKARGMAETARIREGGRRRHARRVLGDHMIGGPEVTELLPALTLAKQWDLTADEVARNVFAHPTLLEAMKEAVEGIAGHMISFDHRMTWPEPGTQRQADADPARKRSSPSSSGTRPSHPLLGVRATEATGLARGRLPRLGSINIHRGIVRATSAAMSTPMRRAQGQWAEVPHCRSRLKPSGVGALAQLGVGKDVGLSLVTCVKGICTGVTGRSRVCPM